VCKPPHWTKTWREDRHYTMTVNGVEQNQSTISADPPELCDAWESWFVGYKLLFEKVVRARESFAVEQIS